MTQNKYYSDKDGLKVLSYNGIITEVVSNRTYGKTWTFKKRAFRRSIKKGKKTIWLRVFKKEAKEAVASFYGSKDLQKYCGVKLYDPKTGKDGNLLRVGNTYFSRRKNKYGRWSKWEWFLKIYSLTDADALRSCDDVDVDTIVFDEFSKTQDKLNKYRGNFVSDFLDILFSSKREHMVRCFILGNKEVYNNPFNKYFGIKPLPTTFEGIRTFRDGSFVIQQINNKPREAEDAKKKEYDRKMDALLKGTPYGQYIYNSEYRNATGLKTRKTPADASLYCQLLIEGQLLKISTQGGYFYVNARVDKNKPIYCDELRHRFKNERQLVKRQKQFFIALVNAIADNRVYFDNIGTYEAMQPFYKWLSI